MMIRRGSGTISSFTNAAGEEVNNVRIGEGQIEEIVDAEIDSVNSTDNEQDTSKDK